MGKYDSETWKGIGSLKEEGGETILTLFMVLAAYLLPLVGSHV